MRVSQRPSARPAGVCMFFDIRVLEKQRIPFDHTFGREALELPEQAGRQVGLLRATGVAELVDAAGAREIRVRGRVEVEMEFSCARCLAPIPRQVACAMDLYYRPMSQIARQEEVSISEAETEVGFYEGDGLELLDAVREQVLTELPMRSFCREDCRGLCPTCGANRNRQACSCQESLADPRWEVLRKWKV